MTVSMRTCAGPVDFPAISDFLYGLYQPSYRDAGKHLRTRLNTGGRCLVSE